jgi:hypothetical protein
VEAINGEVCIIFKSWIENPEINVLEIVPQMATSRNTLEAREVVRPKPAGGATGRLNTTVHAAADLLWYCRDSLRVNCLRIVANDVVHVWYRKRPRNAVAITYSSSASGPFSARTSCPFLQENSHDDSIEAFVAASAYRMVRPHRGYF